MNHKFNKVEARFGKESKNNHKKRKVQALKPHSVGGILQQFLFYHSGV